MDMFEKATKAVKEVGENVFDSAKSIGSSIYSTSKAQGGIAGMKVQKSVVEKRIQESYAVIGKRYVEYMDSSEGSEAFDVSDVIEAMRPDMEKLEELIASIEEKEIAARKEEERRRQKKAQDDYETKKAKLDKALALDIITQEEYEKKVFIIQKRLDNYEQLRKIDLQLQMGIISEDEHEEKINKILS